MSSVVIDVVGRTPLAAVSWFAHGEDWRGDPDEEAFTAPCVIATTRGRWTFHGRSGRVVADESVLVLGRGGESYRCTHDERIPSDVTLSVSLDHELADERLPRRSELPRSTRTDVLLRSLARRGQSPLRLEELAVGLLLELSGDQRPARYVSGAQRAAVAVARERLDGSLEARVTLGELAATAHLSPFHLHRLFRAVVGVPPHEYLARARIRRALALLEQGHSVTAVSGAVGYGTPASFSRAFKRRVGVAPSRYRP